MSFLKVFTDSNGGSHPESWWVVGSANINFTNKTINFLMVGYHDQAAYENGDLPLGDSPLAFSITEPAIFDLYISYLFTNDTFEGVGRIENSVFEGVATGNPLAATFFVSATRRSNTPVKRIEVGRLLDSVVEVEYLGEIGKNDGTSATNFVVNVNGSPVTISTVTLTGTPLTTLQIALAAALDANDEVTVEYDFTSASLFVNDAAVAPILERAASNSIGAHLDFSRRTNTINLLTIL